MPWERRFVADLTTGTEAPTFIVKSVVMPEPLGKAWEIRGPQRPELLSPGLVDTVDIDGSRVSTDTWSATSGGITISLIGDVSALLPRLRRGQVVEVLAGFTGYDDTEYECVALGQVFGFSRRGVGLRYELVLRDIWAGLSSRFSASVEELALFSGMPPPTTVLNAYTAADPTIAIALNLEFPKETGKNGAMTVVDDGGNTFVLTWSSSLFLGPGRRYTIAVAGALGTVDANAGAGNEAAPIAYIKAEPVDIIRKILASTGTGTNGVWDTLPQTWGYGIPDRLIDHEDIDNTRALTRTDNPDRDWEAWSTESQANGLAWIFGEVFQSGGWFPVIHQGAMSVRAAVEPFTLSTNLATDVLPGNTPFIEDIMLAREPLDRWTAWSPDHSVEYLRFTAVAGASSNSLTELVSALPAEDTKTVDVTAWVHNNKAQHLATLVHRMHVYAHRVPERFTINLPNLRLVTHAVGAMSRLTSAVLHGRLKSTAGGFFNVPVLITQMSVNLQRRTMRVSFEVVAETTNDL